MLCGKRKKASLKNVPEGCWEIIITDTEVRGRQNNDVRDPPRCQGEVLATNHTGTLSLWHSAPLKQEQPACRPLQLRTPCCFQSLRWLESRLYTVRVHGLSHCWTGSAGRRMTVCITLPSPYSCGYRFPGRVRRPGWRGVGGHAHECRRGQRQCERR